MQVGMSNRRNDDEGMQQGYAMREKRREHSEQQGGATRSHKQPRVPGGPVRHVAWAHRENSGNRSVEQGEFEHFGR